MRGLHIEQIPIRVNWKRQESRLLRSTAGYFMRSMLDIFRIQLHYSGHRFFPLAGLMAILVSAQKGNRIILQRLLSNGKKRAE